MSLETGFFGVKPEMVIKGGAIVWAQMGDPNASIPSPGPVYMRPMFGSFGGVIGETSITFVSKKALEEGVPEKLGLTSRVAAVFDTRTVRKTDLKLNNATPKMEVDPETYEVRADGELLTCEPLAHLPMTQRYFLF